jgi:hypothetical protein
MIELNRRTLFGAMGAGLVLAGCRRSDKKEDAKAIAEKPLDGDSCGAVGSSAGESALWGDTVNRETPRGVPPGTPFTPDYLCAAYIRLEPTGIVVRQGHVKLTGSAVTSETEQNQIARQLLAALKSPGSPTNVNVEFRHDNFDDFSLNGKQVLVLFVDNDPALARFVSAADMPPAKPGGGQEDFLDHIVRFTQFSGETLGEQVQKNFSFCALKAVTPPLQGFDSDLAYRLNFWNRNMAGQQIQADKNDPATQYRYSMNIHLRIAAKPGGGGMKTFPVILDPDTGNMGSNP